MKKNWWKILTVLLLIYVIIAGLLFEVPRMDILNETIRNLYFHVPMWFGMVILLFVSVIYSIKYLLGFRSELDVKAVEFANTGVLFGILGIVTGMIWARYTWGDYWSRDPKQDSAAIGLLIYFAYFVLRGAFSDDQQRARISAVYNIFAFPTLIALIFVLPRLQDSLHPGNGGNPGFNAYDLDSRMRAIFYPAVIGFTLLGVWVSTLRIRLKNIEYKLRGIE
ncbi:cytochrome c biogenesis protein CcsA [Cytophagaceae bacterium ABcell3]|nr:cytochrome c biogenesis protein CcsA [Cytophagaceae bacterium ABcell3]